LFLAGRQHHVKKSSSINYIHDLGKRNWQLRHDIDYALAFGFNPSLPPGDPLPADH